MKQNEVYCMSSSSKGDIFSEHSFCGNDQYSVQNVSELDEDEF